jgi:hypothetical protein
MEDLYRVLGLSQNASTREIKKAYRKLALSSHPDRGGDTEVMGLLNKAYEILADPAERRAFDERLGMFRESDVDLDDDAAVVGHFEAGPTPPYSQAFQEQHEALVIQYAQTPLEASAARDNFKLFESGIYRFEEQETETIGFHDIFTFINQKATHSADKAAALPKPRTILTPVLAIKIFMDFLSGGYYGIGLITIKGYLSAEMNRLREMYAGEPELLLIEGILEIILMTDGMPDDKSKLMLSIKKITDFAKQASESSLLYLIPLFYNKYFRNLFSYALHLYWQSNSRLFDVESLQQFDGRVEARELLDVLRERLSRSERSEGLVSLVQYVKLLFKHEKDLHESRDAEQTASDCRKRAFQLLDWIPTFAGRASKQIIVNICLQIGINFQQASILEDLPAIKMADEKLALKMHLTAVSVGHHSTPDVEMYANTQVLKYVSVFQFQDSMLAEAIPALQKRTLVLADVFPFFEGCQPNVAFLRQEDKTINLMRRLLNTMIEILEYNKTHSESVLIEHSAVTILYQAYEACLKNWYQEEYDSTTEQKFRLNLMEELLFENSWTFLDVDQNVDSPWVMVDRDHDGWMKPSRSLPYKEDASVVKYRAISGAEVNYKTGNITFFMDPWREDRPVYEKTFTLFDLQEMLAKNLAGAIFSLDPVDPDKPYHPFNTMRFAPSQLCESELLNTMLLTDYVLKFLTTKQEVQGQYPYSQRPIDQMIQHLPEYLRKIIDDFHGEQHSGATHRFWIEAEEIDVLLSDEVLRKDDIARVGLGGLRMVVKKHRMERDIHGDLKDVGSEDEGWPIYILTSSQKRELDAGIRNIPGHAMIFIRGENRVHFLENKEITHSFSPENYRETLIRLHRQPREDDGKVTQSSENIRLIYRLTKEMARQSGLSHRYSPEFIFAHEFTTHYDEFAQYLPEFGRLKELSKISSLIRFLNGLREKNKKNIQALTHLLTIPLQPAPDTDEYRGYKSSYMGVFNNITSKLQEWSKKLSSSVLLGKWQEKVGNIKRQFGTLTFGAHSPEVEDACQRWHDQVSRDNPGVSSGRIWNEVINPKKSELASQMTEEKQKSCRQQLNEVFSPMLSSLSSSAYRGLINAFIAGNINPLASALAKHEQSEASQDIKKAFPHGSTGYVRKLL